jgi:hypothetical protein
MSLRNRPLMAGLKAELGGLAADAKEMLRLRFELARLEIKADIGHLKCLVIVWGAAAVMALTSLPILAVFVADVLDGRLGVARRGWLLIFGLALLCTAGLCAYFGRVWFGRRFVGLRQTMEELREDLEWINEERAARDEG